MSKFKVTLDYEVAAEIKSPDGTSCMGTYPDKNTLEVYAPNCMVATALVIGVMADTFSERKEFIRIKNSYVQEVEED